MARGMLSTIRSRCFRRARAAASAPLFTLLALVGFAAIYTSAAMAHGVGKADAQFVAETRGAAIFPFAYLGAKHMVTGYDHLLYLVAVIFHVRRVRDAVIFATLFSLGHSLTLLAGVLLHTDVSSALVDAVIGLSIVYKAFENLGGFRSLFGISPNPRIGVFGFGLIHGLGLATKLLSLRPSPDGLTANLVSFNIGVEIGQFLALGAALFLLFHIRLRQGIRGSQLVNGVLRVCGFVLAGYHLGGIALGGDVG